MNNQGVLAERLLHALRDYGATEVFGIPGDFALPFFKVMEESAILPLHTLSHEPGVGFAADAAARINRGLGVAAVTYGAGALNLINTVACAYAERSPLVVISGAPSRSEQIEGLVLHHQTRTLNSQYRMFEEITCAQTRLDDPEKAPQEIARVLRACRDHALPVYIELPRDMVSVPCGSVPLLAPAQADPAAVAECAEEILTRLRQAAQPVLMVDAEVRRYDCEAAVAALARRLGLPVVTTFMGRGVLGGHGLPALDTYLGAASHPQVRDLVEGADFLLLFGVIPSDTNFAEPRERLELRSACHVLGRAVRIGHHHYHSIPLPDLLAALLTRLGDAPEQPVPQGHVTYARGLPQDQQGVAPSDIACALNDAFAVYGPMPIASDIGDCMFTAMEIDHGALVGPGFYATMGFGVPAGLGVQAASGQRPVILVGDGAFQMTGWELGNCRHNGWNPIVIVLNNRSWEMLRAFQPASRFNDLSDWHFADLSPALGGRGQRVQTRAELKAALDRAITDPQKGQFDLIEVMIEPGCRSVTLTRFVEGISQARAKAAAAMAAE
ncbi:indolepyruvate/phenylpyruvate decarboxylase [Novispirillum itersonii]|uniref:indolepyruvate/phenylpyruvate decarboxylase n=1 Tax=Novispirillum itersonii TaxID=189 RepID=UPI00036E8E7C|nr:indolepyruvate/phenylpyruvate decarboxylase [Novispirillum itersonii]